MESRQEIDGLRAIAVLPVLLFHAGFETFSGGFVGVDVFFVISGYLITRIILADLERNRFSIIGFYERRARRILPALFLVMLFSTALSWFFLLPVDMKDFSQSLLAVPLFSSNILFWHESGYFDRAGELKPLLHTWSLAVEEQYYLLFPLFLVFFWKKGWRWVCTLFGLAFIVSLAAAQWMAYERPAAAFYLLPTRAWELIFGAFAALYLARCRAPGIIEKYGEPATWLGIFLILFAVFSYDGSIPFPGFYALVPTSGALLIILFSQHTRAARFIGNRWFVGIGLMSYSIYLWHQPLFAFARHQSPSEPGPAVFLLLSALSMVLGYFSWKFVETPFRNARMFSSRFIFIAATAASIFFISMGYLGHKSGGFRNRLPAAANFAGEELPAVDNGWCFYSVETIAGLKPGTDGLKCFVGDGKAKVKGILFGDSYAGHYEPLWDTVGRESGLKIHAITTNWCHPATGQEFSGPRRGRSFQQCLLNRQYIVENMPNLDFAVLGGSWGDVLEKNQLRGTLEMIELMASKLRVVVVMAAPKTFDTNPIIEFQRSVWLGYPFDIGKIAAKKDGPTVAANAALMNHSKKFNNVIFVERDSLFRAHGVASDVTDQGIPYSLDGAHISTYGSLHAASNLSQSDEYQRFNALLQ